MLTILKKIGKILWLTVGGFISLWIGYLIYKVYTIPSPGIKLFAIFFLMMGITLMIIYVLVTITGKIVDFSIKKIKK